MPAQFWPLATWPDGSVKWTGVALGATDAPGEYEIVSASESALTEHDAPVRVRRDGDALVVDNGVIAFEIRTPSAGNPVDSLIASIRRGGVTVAEDIGLVSLLQSEISEDGGAAPRRRFRSNVTRVEVEQDGPIRAVVRIEGSHRDESGEREWLPFVVRLVVVAGSAEIRVVHTVVWNGDADADFLAGLGLRAACRCVPPCTTVTCVSQGPTAGSSPKRCGAHGAASRPRRRGARGPGRWSRRRHRPISGIPKCRDDST